ncbi:MAG: dTDP-4-dehydrorhamnose 3,5-epimerase [Gammaproteobacteria bacterium]|jgi:dTDP-4-dehydrorhamnose 3,5-epimerase
MKVTPTRLPEVLLLESDVHGDQRGFFIEYFNGPRFRQEGLDLSFAQLNHSRSGRGVLRGLHYQLRQPQGKLVQVITGEVFDVAVDIRTGSPRFGEWTGEILSEDNHRQLYVPPGFAHGFCVLSERADFLYLCTDVYRPDDEYGVAWNDPDVDIAWPGSDFSVSKKDLALPRLADAGAALPRFGAS